MPQAPTETARGEEGIPVPQTEEREVAKAVKNAARTQADTYFKLVKEFPLTHIRDDNHLGVAQKMIKQLLEQNLDNGAQQYLDVLTDLVEAYEDEHYAIEPASDAEMLRHLLEAKAITQAQLSRDTMIPKSTISEILAGKKSFSRQIIRKLADYFSVDAGVLAANF